MFSKAFHFCWAIPQPVPVSPSFSPQCCAFPTPDKGIGCHRPGSATSTLPEQGVRSITADMIRQRENDWNQRYLEKDTPREEESPSPELVSALSKYGNDKRSVLEIGCGLGTNAIQMAQLGFDVEATDISPECINLATKRATEISSGLTFYQHDFINDDVRKTFDIVFDKGRLHSFLTQDSYNFFAKKVSRCLNENGIWINISGTADNRDDLARRQELSFPRMTLRNIAEAAEPHFEILEIRRSRFGDKNRFYSWVGIFQKRSYFYEL
jgi:SAM-dependent methyltransferase